jgi:hypothetical protein
MTNARVDSKSIVRSMSTLRARLILGALAAIFVIGLLPSSEPPPKGTPPVGKGDVVLYRTIVDRLRAGDGYYIAVGEELRRGHYPTIPIFNWRTPAHSTMVASLSVPIARRVLQGLAMTGLFLLPLVLARQSAVVIVVAILAQMGAVATVMKPDAVLFGEVWAGVLIALSLCAYYAKQWSVAAVLGIVAVFMRELAAPYCLACGLLAIASRRRRESIVWIVGGTAYVIYYAIHATQSWAHQQPGDLRHVESWIRWNGLTFTIATAQMNSWVRFAPHWIVAAFIVVGLAGSTSTRAPQQVRVSLLTYAALFAVAGQPFDFYWGLVTSPIWAFAVAHGFEGFSQLVNAARAPTPASVATR